MIALGGAAVSLTFRSSTGDKESGEMLTLYTFGDSILDCGRYNAQGVHPGQLIVRNDDRIFPEFCGQDLSSRGPARLEHMAQDGATVENLPIQSRGVTVGANSIAIVTIGGNDLLRGLIVDTGPGIRQFREALDSFLRRLPIRPVLLGNVYDPSFGNDTRNFVGADPKVARANHARVNTVIEELAERYGKLVDLYAHFMTGDPTWYTQTIEPSLVGTSEVRRAFLAQLL